jgi:predicted nucleic acid-binding protein
MIDRLLDSVILIDHFNEVPQATRFLSSLDPQKTAISAITRAEVLVGVDEDAEPLVKAFLDQYRLLNIDKPAADLAASLRREHGWKLPDAFQAALSVIHGCSLTTRDTKDFDPERHEFLEVPYSM